MSEMPNSVNLLERRAKEMAIHSNRGRQAGRQTDRRDKKQAGSSPTLSTAVRVSLVRVLSGMGNLITDRIMWL